MDRTENSASKNNENQSSSIKKLKIPPSLAATDLSDDHYILINFLVLQKLIETKKGWSNIINISYCECGWTKYIYTAKEVNIPGQSGQKSH